MRQVGVVASMANYAIQNNVQRLAMDHSRATTIARALYDAGFNQPQEGNIDTNIVYFGLPDGSNVTKDELCDRLRRDYGILLSGGYNRGGELFRICTHMDINDEDVDRAVESIISLCLQKS